MKTAKIAQPSAATTTTAPSNDPTLVIVKRDLKLRGARQAWYDRLVAMDGKPKSEVLAALEKDRPSVYGTKSKHMGKPEPVAGWVRFYERNNWLKFAEAGK